MSACISWVGEGGGDVVLSLRVGHRWDLSKCWGGGLEPAVEAPPGRRMVLHTGADVGAFSVDPAVALYTLEAVLSPSDWLVAVGARPSGPGVGVDSGEDKEGQTM